MWRNEQASSDTASVREGRVRVLEVALIALDLARGMEAVDEAAPERDGHAVGDRRRLEVGPLLELDDDGFVTPLAAGPGDKAVEALEM